MLWISINGWNVLEYIICFWNTIIKRSLLHHCFLKVVQSTKRSFVLPPWQIVLAAGWILLCFLAFDFCRFCVVIRFYHPGHNGQWPPTSKDFLSQILSITFIFLSWFLRKSQFFPFWMFSAKQGHYWYYFYNIFGMTRSLTGDWTRE